MQYDRLTLRERTPDEVHLMNQLSLHQTVSTIINEASTLNVVLRYHTSAGDELMSQEASYCQLHLSLGAIPLILLADTRVLLAWVNNRFPVNDLESLPTAIGTTVLQHTLAPFFTWLETQFEQPVLLDSYAIIKNSDDIRNTPNVSLQLTQADRHTYPSLTLLCSAEKEVVTTLLGAFPRYTQNTFFTQHQWPARLIVGISSLPMLQLRDLNPGDIVFFQEQPTANCIFLLITTSLLLQCRMVKPNTLMIEQTRELIMTDPNDKPTLDRNLLGSLFDGDKELDDDFFKNLMKEDENASPEIDTLEDENNSETSLATDDTLAYDETALPEVEKNATEPSITATPIDTRQLPVAITFDIGNAHLPLSKLQTLQTGYCFELPQETTDYVTLRVHGQVIGQGELVQVGNRLGVEITQMSHATEEVETVAE